MRLLYVFCITSVLAGSNPQKKHKPTVSDWQRKHSLQVVEQHERNGAKNLWGKSAKSFAQGRHSEGQAYMTAGLTASSLSQNLQKTVGRMGMAKPDKKIVIKLSEGDPPVLPQYGPKPQMPSHPNKFAHIEKVNLARELSIDRSVKSGVDRRKHNIGRFDLLSHAEKDAHMARIQPLRSEGDNERDHRVRLGEQVKKDFATRARGDFPDGNIWTVKYPTRARQSTEAWI